MSRIDIAELNDFLHGLRSSNAEAKDMIGNITQAAADYAQDDRLKGAAVTASKQYFTDTYMPIIQSIIEALNESEERLAQYIREFGAQVDPSPSAKVDAQILQEVMEKVSQLQRKEEDLHQQLTAPNTRPDMEQVYVVKSRSVHTQLLRAIEKENILERYLAFEQSHGDFFSALHELILATGRTVQELLQHVTFNAQTGTYTVSPSVTSSLQVMKKALDNARKENDKDPYPDGFEDYTLFAYTYVNDKGKNVTMWLIEKNGKRIENKELQDFLEKNGQDLPLVSYTELSGEDLERKVNDSWKEGVNYLTGQKVTGASAGILRTSAYIASGKDVMDDTGLTDMALGLGFGIAGARNKPVLKEKISPPEVKQTVSGKQWNNYFKEKYGAGNVQWKPTSFDDIVANPERLYGSTKKEIKSILGSDWIEDTYGSAGGGWKFINKGDGMIFYHPGGGIHKGSYYGFSSGKTGRVKIVSPSDNYAPTTDDGATVIIIK